MAEVTTGKNLYPFAKAWLRRYYPDIAGFVGKNAVFQDGCILNLGERPAGGLNGMRGVLADAVRAHAIAHTRAQ